MKRKPLNITGTPLTIIRASIKIVPDIVISYSLYIRKHNDGQSINFAAAWLASDNPSPKIVTQLT